MKSLPCLLRTVIPAGAVFPPQGLPPNTNPNARLFRHRGGRQDVFISATADDYYSTPTTLIVNDNETEIIEHPPYDEWITGYGISGPNFEPDEDFDGDGVENVLEWAFGTNPKLSSPVALLVNAGTITNRGGPTTLTVNDELGGAVRLAAFARRKDRVAAGLTYFVEFSSDLETWTLSADVPTVIADDGEIEIVTVPYPPLLDGQIANFFRVEVTLFEEEE